MKKLVVLLPDAHYVPRTGEHVVNLDDDVIYLDAVPSHDDTAELVYETAYTLRCLMRRFDADSIQIVGLQTVKMTVLQFKAMSIAVTAIAVIMSSRS